MLSAADTRLARRERAILGLATVLDPEALRAALQAEYPDCAIGQLFPYFVHYKPGTRCHVAFRLTAGDDGDDLRAYAAAYGPDAAAKLHKACRLAQADTGPLGQAALVLEARNIVFHVFPTDRRLKATGLLEQPGKRERLMRALFPDRPEYSQARLRHLRYKPERRYVARADAPDGGRAVIKFYNEDGYRAARRGAGAFSSRGALHHLACSGHLDARRVLAFDWQPGESLHTLLSDSQDDSGMQRRALELTGAALAELHAQTPQCLERPGNGAEGDRLMAQAGTLAQLCPELRAVAERLARDCLARLDEAPPILRSLHGDFNAEQVLIGDEPRATILDLDWARLGDPATDPGLFIAHLERSVLRGHLQPARMERFANALLEGYAAVSEPPSRAAIRLYTAIGLFYLAAEPFRYREPAWPERIEAQLARARTILDDRAGVPKTGAVARSGRGRTG